MDRAAKGRARPLPLRVLSLLLPALAGGCNLILDAGEHHLGADDFPTPDGGGGGKAGAGPGGSGGGGAGAAGSAGTGGGACVPVSGPVVIATGQGHPILVRISGSYVYWINEGDAQQPGSIWRIQWQQDPPGAPEPVVPSISNPTGIRFKDSWLYFTNDLGGNATALHKDFGLFRVAPTGGEVVAVGENDYPAGNLHLSAGYFFSEARSLAPDEPVRLRRTSPSTGETCYPFTATVNGGRIPFMDGDADEVFFFESPGGTIWRQKLLDMECGSPQIVTALATGQVDTRAIQTGSRAMVVRWATGKEVISKKKYGTGATPEHVADALNPRGITIGMDALYFTNGDGTVQRVKNQVTGPIASCQDQPAGIAATTTDVVFWCNYGSGEIVRRDP